MHPLSFIIILFTTLCHAALPPGYEDELYCPADMCLKRREQPHGWCGPRTMFRECCDESTGRTHAPRAWGDKLPIEIKEELLGQGWHGAQCARWTGRCGDKDWEMLVVRVDALLV